MPCAARISAAIEQKVSPRNRGSRPTITRAPFDFCEATYRAIPSTARRTLTKVNSSAITARHPDVPNLICVGIANLSQLQRRFPYAENKRSEEHTSELQSPV